MSDKAGLFVAKWVMVAAMVFTGLAIFEEQRHARINRNHKTLESVVVGIMPKVSDLEKQAERMSERIEQLEKPGLLNCE